MGAFGHKHPRSTQRFCVDVDIRSRQRLLIMFVLLCRRLRAANTEIEQHCVKLKRTAVSLEEKLAAVREELSAAKR